MARVRKPGAVKHSSTSKNGSHSSSSSETSEKNPIRVLSFWKTIVTLIILVIAVYFGTLGYLETRVNTPFNNEKVVISSGLSVPDRYWGSYRPGVYFGLKTRDPRSPVFGLMWYLPSFGPGEIRHWCDQGDNLPSYGWVRHDGVNFGHQVIIDNHHTITTTFIKTLGGDRGGVWTARIDVQPTNNTHPLPISLIWYAALDESLGPGSEPSRLWNEGNNIVGHTPQLKQFKISFEKHKGRILHRSIAEAKASGLNLLKEKVYSIMNMIKTDEFGKIVVLESEEDLHTEGREVNFVATQLLVETPFTLDVVYTNEESFATPLKGDGYSKLLEQKIRAFDEEFENKFGLKAKGYPEISRTTAMAALSNMLGGIGYFYGSGRVSSTHTTDSVPYWRAPLYTAVPSRSFFPRGFLWDEGFHGLLIGKWSPEIQMDIAAHWFDLTNVEGWIPREQILGAEALGRVPREFVVQSNSAANPPMFLLQLSLSIIKQKELSLSQRTFLERAYDRLMAWYNWFHTTQKGYLATSYRWRGRNDDGLQLNPKTLTSGLDDYPRASHPSDIERHVDLRCWIYAATNSMYIISQALGKDTTRLEAIRDQLGDEVLLNKLHWSTQTQTYADYGLHTDAVRLVRTPAKPHEPQKVIRAVTSTPQAKLVTSAFGYVSLFPMLLKVLKPTSPNLGKILEDLDRPDLLWSPFGLRSLSKSSPYYMKRNTEHDPPYWRGQLWVNINYLAISALKYYATESGPYSKRAAELHQRLRDNVVGTVINEYKRTGYLWEQYSDDTGFGSGSRPFTGWTALVVLLMADDY